MGCKIIFSPQALADLASAVRFITQKNPKGILSISPALPRRRAAKARLRRVINQSENNPERVESIRGDLIQPHSGLKIFFDDQPGVVALLQRRAE
jgi:hypothetical protein